MLPQSEWQAAPADSVRDDDVDESDSEEQETAEAAVGKPSETHSEHAGGPQQSFELLDGAMQQLQLHTSAKRMVRTKLMLYQMTWFLCFLFGATLKHLCICCQ